MRHARQDHEPSRREEALAKEECKTCFVLAPIGELESEVRKRSDQILRHIIQPAVKSCGYEPLRADQISEPGIITTQIIQHIIDDPLVVADLTGRNPNVFYELAIRHALRKPYVQLIQKGERIPFDVAATRTVEVDHRDLDMVDAAKAEIVRQIQSMEGKGAEIDSPISVAVDLEALRQSGNPEQRQLADILAAVAELRSGLSVVDKRLSDPKNILPPAYLRDMTMELRAIFGDLGERLERFGRPEVHPRLIEELLFTFDQTLALAESFEGKEPKGARLEQMMELRRRLEVLMRDFAMESGMPRGILEEFMSRRARRAKSE
jgi:hypothetical protein